MELNSDAPVEAYIYLFFSWSVLSVMVDFSQNGWQRKISSHGQLALTVVSRQTYTNKSFYRHISHVRSGL
jgi:hypothetical protein